MLKLQGKSEKTRDAYARAIRRLRDHFGCCPDKLTVVHQIPFQILVQRGNQRKEHHRQQEW
nr:hypothetical protein [Desulfosarcina alkanivorans]